MLYILLYIRREPLVFIVIGWLCALLWKDSPL